MRTVIIALVFFLIPIAGLTAHGTPFFEFNPDDYDSSLHEVVFSPTPYQIFIPQNDFLNGFDFWLANPGSAGTATFQLLDEIGNVLGSKTVTIPTINKIAGGTRFHIDLDSQIPVINNKKYLIKIESSLPKLGLYYSNRIRFLLHNAPYVSEYLRGVARLGSEETNFSFKYALYEGQEAKLPVISNVSAVTISADQVKISFNASEPVDYKISYQAQGQAVVQNTNFSGGYRFCSQGIDVCSLIVDVIPNQTYDYTLTVRDQWGNQSQFTGAFSSVSSFQITPIPAVTASASVSLTPTPLSDTIPPQISNFRIVNLNANSANFTWDTNEAADSFLLISFSVNLITIAADNDTTFEFSHLLKTGPTLNPDTIYFATVTSHDLANNTASATLSFTTPRQSITAPTPSPTPTTITISPGINQPPPPEQPITSPAKSNPAANSNFITQSLPPLNVKSAGNSNSISVAWNQLHGSEPSNGYRVDIFDQEGRIEQRIAVPAGTYQITVDNLADGNHNVIVYADNNAVNQKIAQPARVTTPRKSGLEKFITYLPYILGGLVVIILIAAAALKFLKKPDGGQITPGPTAAS